MRKAIKRTFLCLLAAASFWLGALASDRVCLKESLIRLHVVANSDSAQDQAVKLLVKDAVVKSLRQAMENVSDVDQARVWIEENLTLIRDIANEALRLAGSSDAAEVSLCQEAFDTRHYDTFSLPAGVYNSLKITIGDGAGKNWWCVAFPSLCLPATAEGFEAAAAGAGFSEAVTGTLLGRQEYQVRFYLLELLGRAENIFCPG